ncbi:MAG: aminodeoxychorismate lyase [Thalassotalea sp.]|nr:aminodeoxychorismate lyase [Thalassotalea sp.]
MLYNSVNFIQSSQLSITDRGLAFGDGIFTTAKVSKGKIEHFDQHIQRLLLGCQRLSITDINWQAVKNELVKASKSAHHIDLATLKVIITAGNNKRGYSRVGIEQANVIVTVTAFPSHYSMWQDQGITLGLSRIKLGHNPQLAGLKHLNRLEQVLVRNELDQLAVDEVVVTDLADDIIECNTANIFWCKDNVWYTPSLMMAGVNGIIREQIIANLLATNNEVEVVKAKVNELQNSDAIFICNSLLGIAPVKQFMTKSFAIEPVKKIQKLMHKEFD